MTYGVIGRLELLFHRPRTGSGWSSNDPVARGRVIDLQAKYVLSQCTQNQTGWKHGRVVDKEHQHGVHYVVQQQTQAEPKLVEWRQKLRTQHAGSKACCRNGKRQRPWSITMHHRPQADERKDACQDDAEVAVRPASNRPICDDCLSIGHRQLYGIDLAPINMMTPPTSTSTNMVTREKALRSIRPATSPRLVA